MNPGKKDRRRQDVVLFEVWKFNVRDYLSGNEASSDKNHSILTNRV